MSGGGGGGEGEAGAPRELDQTATWAVAAVCTVIVIISILLEKGLHRMGEYLRETKKKHLNEALEKIKAELMILGFISLLLTFGQKYIAKICIPEELANTMLPCRLKSEAAPAEPEWKGGESAHPKPKVENEGSEGNEGNEGHSRRLLSHFIMHLSANRRFLSEGGEGPTCALGKVSLVSADGLHQLHIFIFFLAVFHVLGSAITMALGRAKIRGWKDWEAEIQSSEFEYENDPQRFRFTHETSFVKKHTSSWNKMAFSFYAGCFFRQFFGSVGKADYSSMRHGFVSVHIAPGSKFDFQKYIKRSLEDDFRVVVGISPPLWASAVIFLLLNVNGWRTLLWISIMPMIIILAVGTKLQAIITQMALEITERHAVVQGIPLVQVSDRHFWFGRPHLVLFLIHFTLFQNAFQLIYLLWIGYEFGWNSCFHDTPSLITARVALGIGVQFLCSYITLPLYALVSQMGTHMKRSIFDDQTSKALTNWRKNAKKNVKEPSPNSPPRSPTVTVEAPAPQPLQRMNTTSRSSSRRRKSMEQEATAVELNVQPNPAKNNDLLTGTEGHHANANANANDDDFYLVKL